MIQGQMIVGLIVKITGSKPDFDEYWLLKGGKSATEN